MEKELIGTLPDGTPLYRDPPLTLPCENLLEFVKYFLEAYYNRNLEQLDYLLDSEFSPYKDMYHQYHTNFMCKFIIKMLYRDRYTEDKSYKGSEYERGMIAQWMNYDKNTIDALVEDSFFDEYLYNFIIVDPTSVKKRDLIDGVSQLGYSGLEFYVYFKVLSLAASLLGFNRTHMLWYYLCYEYLIEIIKSNQYNSILSPIYRKFGWQWFSANKSMPSDKFEPVLYKWACYAICADKKMPDRSYKKLQKDMNNLFIEFSRKCAQAKCGKFEDEILQYLFEEMNRFDKEELARAIEVADIQVQKIVELEEKLKKKERRILQLEKTNESLIKSYRTTVKNIPLIQGEKDTDGTNKIDRILRHLYECLPDELAGDTLKKKFGDIWENLSEYSQDDITKSIKMFEMMQDSEFSTLALLRSVERELELNVFQPFRESELFKNIEDFSCTFKKVEGTHKSLQRPVTLGSIPFIGRDVNNERYIQESSVLQAFAEFLGDKKEVFTEICRSIDQYKIDNGMKSIVDLRNGIAHGDATVTEFCDESCYHDICKFIYEPPIQIMFSIILHSLKGT